MTDVNFGLKCKILKHIVNITIAVKNIKGTACEYYSNEVFYAVDGHSQINTEYNYQYSMLIN